MNRRLHYSHADSPGFPEKNLNALTSRGCTASESRAAPNSGVGVETGKAVGDATGDCTDAVGIGVEITADTAGGAAVGDALCTGIAVDSRVRSTADGASSPQAYPDASARSVTTTGNTIGLRANLMSSILAGPNVIVVIDNTHHLENPLRNAPTPLKPKLVEIEDGENFYHTRQPIIVKG